MISQNALLRIEHVLAPDIPVWRRASTALALSAVLHFTLLYSLGAPARGAPVAAGHDETLTVRLLPPDNNATTRPSETTRATEAPAQERSTPQGSPDPGPRGAIPGPSYYLSSELDRRPTPLQPIEPSYPSSAAEHATRYVVLRIFINERGNVDQVTAANAESDGAFEKSARTAFEKAHFAPGLRNGAPVRSQLMVEVKFDPGDAVPLGEPASGR